MHIRKKKIFRSVSARDMKIERSLGEQGRQFSAVKEAYQEAYAYLTGGQEESDKIQACMVGFVLGNTLSENGGVTRGICTVDESGHLVDIVETSNIEKTADGAAIREGDSLRPVDIHVPVSMNMWGLHPDFCFRRL